MARTPNYRLDRAERTRSKAAKKQEKADAKAARRAVDGDVMLLPFDGDESASTHMNEDHDGSECTDQEKIQ